MSFLGFPKQVWVTLNDQYLFHVCILRFDWAMTWIRYLCLTSLPLYLSFQLSLAWDFKSDNQIGRQLIFCTSVLSGVSFLLDIVIYISFSLPFPSVFCASPPTLTHSLRWDPAALPSHMPLTTVKTSCGRKNPASVSVEQNLIYAWWCNSIVCLIETKTPSHGMGEV